MQIASYLKYANRVTKLAALFALVIAMNYSAAQSVAAEPPVPAATGSTRLMPEPAPIPNGIWGGTPSYTYLTLQQTNMRGNTNPPSVPDLISPQPTKPYAYGWFGSHPTNHWARQFGWNSRYTQWSLK